MAQKIALLCAVAGIPGLAVRYAHEDFDEWAKSHAADGASTATARHASPALFKLVADDLEAYDYFGYAISISSDGSRVAVGDYYDDDKGRSSGSAYVFDASTGRKLLKLTALDGSAGDCFGMSISISADGSRVAVGAHYDDDGGSSSGSAYLFDGNTGRQLLKLVAEDGAANDNFGGSVSMSSDGGRVAVGAHLDDDKGSSSGSAYLFDGRTGKQLLKLVAEDGTASDFFGRSISVSSDGSRVVVGASHDDDKGSSSGSAYLFDGSNGKQLLKFAAADGEAGDYFGMSVSISSDGGRVAVGACNDDDKGLSSGSVYLFDGWTGTQLVKLVAEDGAAYDRFGGSIQISSDGSRVAISAPNDDDDGSSSGSAYLFDGGTGQQLLKFVADDGAKYDTFGRSVSVSSDGSRVAVGASGDDDKGSSSGSAYIFEGMPAVAAEQTGPVSQGGPVTEPEMEPFATGDPHVHNLAGEHFDINQPADHLLLRLPLEPSRPPLLELRGDIKADDLSNGACSMYIKAMRLHGEWLGSSAVLLRPLRRNKPGSNAAGNATAWPFSIRESSSASEGDWRSVADFTAGGSDVQVLSAAVSVAARPRVEELGDSEAFEFTVGPDATSQAIIVVSQGQHQSLNLQLKNLNALGERRLGGLLGTEKHGREVEELTQECKDIKKSKMPGIIQRTEAAAASRLSASW